MSSIIVRGLDDAVKRRLATQAKEHGRSMEVEVREILTKAAHQPHIGMALLSTAQDVSRVEDLPIPARDDVARVVECLSRTPKGSPAHSADRRAVRVVARG